MDGMSLLTRDAVKLIGAGQVTFADHEKPIVQVQTKSTYHNHIFMSSSLIYLHLQSFLFVVFGVCCVLFVCLFVCDDFDFDIDIGIVCVVY